jgi:PAS domain S-box-containing protein
MTTGAVLGRELARPWDRLTDLLPAGRAAVVTRTLPSTALVLAAAVVLSTVVSGAHPDLVQAALLPAATAVLLAWALPWSAWSPAAQTVVPVLNLVAVGLLCAAAAPASASLAVLVAAPAYALVSGSGRAGVAVAAVAPPAALLLPYLLLPTPAPVPALLGAAASAAITGPAAWVLHDLRTRLADRAARVHLLETERAALRTQMQARSDELDVAARMLAARAQTMTSVIDAVTEQSIIGTDRDGIIRVWNPGAERLLGVPRAEVVRRRSIVDFHLREELEGAAADTGATRGLAALVHAAKQNGSDVRDWTYVAADGRRRTVSVAVTPRTDDRGGHAGWNFVGTDMTEARATERMKDEFVSLISHELRTPLSSILGYLELVLDDEEQPLPDEQQQYLRTVERNAHRLLRLVGDLLFTAQVEAGRFILQPEEVDLVAVVRSAEESARVAAATAQVDIRVDVPEHGLVIDGDPGRLGQACDNLISNAVKFTPPGGRVTLGLRAAWQEPDGTVTDVPTDGAAPVARLSVSDTGMGIPAEEQEKLFTRFFRSSTAQRAAVPGVGLGLSITKAIITAHGGTLDLVSVEGQGTTFTLTLPRIP